MRLYNHELSGNCYKVRLLLALLGIPYETVAVDLRAGETLRPAFLKINPRGQIPVLEDGEVRIWDSMAILVYLARRYGSDDWLPTDPEGLGQVMQWLAVSENEVLYGLARARAVLHFQRPWNLEESQAMGRGALSIIDSQLRNREWLALDEPTIADIACYPYVALAPEGEMPLDEYQAIQAWIGRIQALPGYVAMPGLWEAPAPG